MDGAVLEIGDAGAENEVGGTLYVAVQEIIALDPAILAISAVSVDCVLVPDKAAAMEEQEVAVSEKGHRLGYFLAFSGIVLNGQILHRHIAGMDVNAGAAGGSHIEIAAGPYLFGILAIGDYCLVGAFAADVQTELVVRDCHHLIIDTCAYTYARDGAMTVVGSRIDGLLHCHIVAVAVGRNHYVVAGQMLRQFGNLLLDFFADYLRNLAGPAGDRMGVVVLAGTDHEIGFGAFISEAFQPVESGGGDIEQDNTLFLCHLLHRRRIVGVAVAVEFALLEPTACHRSKQHGPDAFFLGCADEPAEVVLIGAERSCVTDGIVGLGIVVAELDEEPVARFQIGLNLFPKAEVDETLGTAPVLRVIDHSYSVVQEILEHHPPSAFRACLCKVLLRHGGIPYRVDGKR